MKKHLIPSSLRNGLTGFIRLLIYAGAITLFFILMLYTLELLWFFYQHAPTGVRYLAINGPPAIIQVLEGADIPMLGLKIAIITFCVNLSGAAISHFLSLTAHFYTHRGKWVRIVLWALPLSWLSATVIQQYGLTDDAQTAFYMSLPLSPALFSHCFSYATKNLPEINLLLSPYEKLSRLWALLHHVLVLMLLSCVLTMMVLYLWEAMLETRLAYRFSDLLHAYSIRWGHIPVDGTAWSRMKLASALTLTSFSICAGFAVLEHLICGFTKTGLERKAAAIRRYALKPLLVLLCGLGIRYFNQIQPFHAAVILAIAPAVSMYTGLIRAIRAGAAKARSPEA